MEGAGTPLIHCLPWGAVHCSMAGEFLTSFSEGDRRHLYKGQLSNIQKRRQKCSRLYWKGITKGEIPFVCDFLEDQGFLFSEEAFQSWHIHKRSMKEQDLSSPSVVVNSSMIGLYDLGGNFQPQRSYDSINFKRKQWLFFLPICFSLGHLLSVWDFLYLKLLFDWFPFTFSTYKENIFFHTANGSSVFPTHTTTMSFTHMWWSLWVSVGSQSCGTAPWHMACISFSQLSPLDSLSMAHPDKGDITSKHFVCLEGK